MNNFEFLLYMSWSRVFKVLINFDSIFPGEETGFIFSTLWFSDTSTKLSSYGTIETNFSFFSSFCALLIICGGFGFADRGSEFFLRLFKKNWFSLLFYRNFGHGWYSLLIFMSFWGCTLGSSLDLAKFFILSISASTFAGIVGLTAYLTWNLDGTLDFGFSSIFSTFSIFGFSFSLLTFSNSFMSSSKSKSALSISYAFLILLFFISLFTLSNSSSRSFFLLIWIITSGTYAFGSSCFCMSFNFSNAFIGLKNPLWSLHYFRPIYRCVKLLADCTPFIIFMAGPVYALRISRPGFLLAFFILFWTVDPLLSILEESSESLWSYMINSCWLSSSESSAPSSTLAASASTFSLFKPLANNAGYFYLRTFISAYF